MVAVGFQNGVVKIIRAENLQDIVYAPEMDSGALDTGRPASFTVAQKPITILGFSPDSQFLASAAETKLSLFRQVLVPATPDRAESIEWMHIGSYVSHSKPIVGMLFGTSLEDLSAPTLISIGEDRMEVEYNLVNSSIAGGLIVTVRIEMNGLM
jgi:hypothetical protein